MTIYQPSGHHKSAYAQSKLDCADCGRTCDKREMYVSQMHYEKICPACHKPSGGSALRIKSNVITTRITIPSQRANLRTIERCVEETLRSYGHNTLANATQLNDTTIEIECILVKNS